LVREFLIYTIDESFLIFEFFFELSYLCWDIEFFITLEVVLTLPYDEGVPFSLIYELEV